MMNIIIKFPDSLYEDTLAINNVISYISQDAKTIGGYYLWPVEPTTAINQFDKLYDMNPPTFSRRLWHFFISFPPSLDQYRILTMGNLICGSVFENYPIFYGLHAKRNKSEYRYHLHMAVLPVGYCPDIPELSPEAMLSYIKAISELLKQEFHLTTDIINPHNIQI